MVGHESFSFGAECVGADVCFRLWAPDADRVDVVLAAPRGDVLAMQSLGDGWFQLVTDRAQAGSLYHYRIDERILVPDPASRFQPQDVHGPSEVIDPRAFAWTDQGWKGRPWEEVVIYELHIGAWSPEGTYAGAIRLLPALRDLGITAIELMPLSDFPGRVNWGYDGVLPFAPDSSYGRPDDLKALICAAHALGIMVFLDVVYNHFGPDGNYLSQYARAFFTARHHTPWGDAIDFDGPESGPVRSYFLANVRYWLNEYHFDGLRFDAIHAIADESPRHIVSEIASEVAGLRASGRHIHLILENEENGAHFLYDRKARAVHTAQWDDDIHHVLHHLLTGETSAYYADYGQDAARLLGLCLTEGFAYQGGWSAYRGSPRGESTQGVPLSAFVTFLQNHDQIGNRAFGERITSLAPPEGVRAATAIILLAPLAPLLFMGQEFGCRRPFLFFCDFAPALAVAVTAGRRREFARFPEFSEEARRDEIPDPNDFETFKASRIDWREAVSAEGVAWRAFHRELLAVRQRVLVPKLSAGPVCARGFTFTEEGGLSVSWTCADGAVLTLWINMSDRPVEGDRIQGLPLYAQNLVLTERSRSRLGPWGVCAALIEARDQEGSVL